MKLGRIRGAGGFTMAEMIVVLGIIGILALIGAPSILGSWRASTLRASAAEMATVLNNARQLAIKENTNVCVTNNGTRVQFHLTSCGTAAWTGTGTDSNGFIALSNNATVTSAANVTFTYLGIASTAGTYTVTSPLDGRTMSVIVASSGRVTVGP